MRKPWRLLGTAVALALMLTACGASASRPRATASAPARAAAPAAGADRAVVQGYESVPRTALTGYLSSLRAIDPSLAANDVEAWRQGTFLCYEIYAGGPPPAVAVFAAQAYQSLGATPGDAAAIVAAAKAHLCGVPALKKQWQQHSYPSSPSR
ncbi:hypothetical protein G3I60_08935 [Streptomyces sp. SID13666]|uniref:hypothetical protein n=1 Tax=unclassified Streptomyces TaxID=2593676 RepID=UPI0013BF0C4E|nr:MULTISPECIES: hypothetical protein [unclassified Streptomyces]NEA54272.1 hypothetical protein [Streptomyces sp. SID13666]NEA70367.1 hypothetical protein [Streptomyces sp. SID13588]